MLDKPGETIDHAGEAQPQDHADDHADMDEDFSAVGGKLVHVRLLFCLKVSRRYICAAES
jgi:hypothetical protein